MKTQYNYALNPEKDKLPACMVGSTLERDFQNLPVTTDEDAVSCKRCRKALGIDSQ